MTKKKSKREGSLNRDQHQAGFSHGKLSGQGFNKGYTTPHIIRIEQTDDKNLSCETPTHNTIEGPTAPPIPRVENQHDTLWQSSDSRPLPITPSPHTSEPLWST